jgi:cytochrome c-type biogenesis protein CcmH
MRRWTLPVGIGLALGLAAVVVLLAVSTAASRTPAQRAEALAAELRCPDCQGLSVADSPTRSAQEIRRQIHELLAGGATDDDVRAHFTARYGEWIRLAPSSPVLWLVPFVAVASGVVALLAWLARRRPGRVAAPVADPTVGEEERRRVRDEAEALDA